ncbi:SRPBCC family protein [Streptomyces sp. HNM0645]|uniref:type II toxin-antitoxin system Rv0910 family toxin n=1 Tax=Streptomyces sp. HNM0645 TaxID=2782343 RepID=UPI0024B77FA6|nr:SRPBCC family protein [Streptomyces sp. HNM0645]MDI9889052.1 SRPBCC family protein [Streptomyces sp. HNM0645]
MAEVSADALIGAPAAKVWAQLTDFASYGRWNATHTSFPQGAPGTLETGANFTESMKLMGFPAEVQWTVEELEPERVLAIRGKGPMGVLVGTRYTLTPEGGATTVRIDGEFTGAAVSLMAGKLRDSATAALNESLRKLGGLVS